MLLYYLFFFVLSTYLLFSIFFSLFLSRNTLLFYAPHCIELYFLYHQPITDTTNTVLTIQYNMYTSTHVNRTFRKTSSRGVLYNIICYILYCFRISLYILKHTIKNIICFNISVTGRSLRSRNHVIYYCISHFLVVCIYAKTVHFYTWVKKKKGYTWWFTMHTHRHFSHFIMRLRKFWFLKFSSTLYIYYFKTLMWWYKLLFSNENHSFPIIYC